MKWTIALIATLALLVVAMPLTGCADNPNGVEPSLTNTVGDPPTVSGGPASDKNPRPASRTP